MNTLFLIVALCFGSEVDNAYLEGRADLLFPLYHAAETQGDSLLVLYRLYPLTQDAELLQNLPKGLDDGATAAELAILSALWAFRIEDAGPLKLVSYGRKSMDLLRRALELDADDPFALLSEGQSLFYRPEWAGGNKRAALQRFERLRAVVSEGSCGLSAFEAEMWTWFAMSALGHDDADKMKAAILAQDPPALVRQFVTDPLS